MSLPEVNGSSSCQHEVSLERLLPCASSGGSSTSRLLSVRQDENDEVDTVPDNGSRR